jgi:hypothetical protein
MYVERRIQRSGTYVDCLAHNGETAGCANNGDAASPEALGTETGILVVVGAVVEASAAPADGCKYHAATVVPGRRLKCFVPATMSLRFEFVGQ